MSAPRAVVQPTGTNRAADCVVHDVAMSDPTSEIGVGIIGLGAVGRRFVEVFGGHPQFELRAVWDLSDDAVARAVADFDAPTVASAAEVVQHAGVEVVYIAVPPLHHEVYVDQTLAAGKAIFCEKPLGVDGDASAAMVDRVEQAGARAAVNFVFGSAPAATALGAALAAGDAGQIVSADLRLHFEEWPRPFQAEARWLRDRDQGGWVREVVSHYVFLAERLFGEGRIVKSAVTYPADGSAEIGLSAATVFGSTPLLMMGTSDAMGGDEVQFTVRGTERSFRLTNWYQLSTSTGGEWEPMDAGESATGPAAYNAQMLQLANLIGGREHKLSTFAEALRVQNLVEGLLEEPS